MLKKKERYKLNLIPLDLQQYLSTLEKVNLLTNLNIDNIQTSNYALYHV